MNNIYLDNASTTKIGPEVLKTMLPFLTENYGNSHSLHSLGIKSKEAIDKSKISVSKFLNCSPTEIIFCSGASEANNMAITGIIKNNPGKTIITSKLEHLSILKQCDYLERKQLAKIIYVKNDKTGIIDIKDLETKIIHENPGLVSVQYVNNEIGTIQNIREIGKICENNKTIFHVDASQAGNLLSLDTKELKVNLMTLSGSKIHGPKGSGALFKQTNIKLEPIIIGGHENILESGTQNTACIVGLAKALEIAQTNLIQRKENISKLQQKLFDGIFTEIKKTKLIGPEIGENRLCANLNIKFSKVEGKELLFYLDSKNICVSTGSACTSSENKASHVLTSVGLTESEARKCIRFSLSFFNTEEEIDNTIWTLKEINKKIEL